MESEKRQDRFRSILGNDVGRALRGCQMSARGFFYELIPFLEVSQPFGHLQMTTEELSDIFKVSLHMTRRYLFELKSHRVLREGKDGALFCPVLIRLKYRELLGLEHE